MAITLSRRALLALAVAAAALGVATFFFFSAAEDENPIRVKNKQLLIESEDDKAEWDKPGAAEKWRLKVDGRKTATQYTVTAYGADPTDGNPCLKSLEGDTAEIQFQATEGARAVLTFTLPLSGNKNEPVVDVSGVTMTKDNSKKVKRLRLLNTSGGPMEGAITQLVVRKANAEVGTCRFPADRKVSVELCMHSCS